MFGKFIRSFCRPRVKLKGIRSAFFTVVLSCVPVALSATSVGDAPAIKLVEHLKPLNTLSGAFDQRQTGSGGELLSESSGHFKMQRPGMLRWQTVEPFPQLLVTDGEAIWMYDSDLEQVTVSKVTSQLMNTPAIIFSGNLEQINTHYRVTSGDDGHYRLHPLGAQSNFQRLDLAFADGVLREMVILDSFGQQTEFKLREVVATEPVSVDEFRFIPPEGTDVFLNE